MVIQCDYINTILVSEFMTVQIYCMDCLIWLLACVSPMIQVKNTGVCCYLIDYLLTPRLNMPTVYLVVACSMCGEHCLCVASHHLWLHNLPDVSLLQGLTMPTGSGYVRQTWKRMKERMSTSLAVSLKVTRARTLMTQGSLTTWR